MKIKNILAIRNDRFGEFLLNIPAWRALKDSYPGSRLTLVVASYCGELAKAIACVDEVIAWENRRHGFWEIFNFAAQLRSGKFDLCVIFNPSKESNLAAFLAGIPVRVGYDRKWGMLLTRRMPDNKYRGDKHEVEYNLELAALAGAGACGDKSLSLALEPGAARGFLPADIEEGTADLIVVHPWTSDPVKQWPLENFYALARRLSGLPRARVLIIGGKEELVKGAERFSDKNDGLINITGKTSLLELAGVLKDCRLLISGDSGPVHLAACAGIPVLAIFKSGVPAKGPQRWGPWGQGHAIVEKDNLSGITVEEVFARAKEMLTK